MTAASTGFVGAFTTFSSFSFDIVTLLAHQAYGLVVVYAGLSIFGGLGALIAGLALSHYLIERQVMTQWQRDSWLKLGLRLAWVLAVG